MAKNEKSAESNEGNEFPAFDATKAVDQFRAIAEKGAEQSKEAYAKVKANAEEAKKLAEETLGTVTAATNELSLKTIAAVRANAELGFSHLEALVSARSPSEIIEHQTAFLRKGAELAVQQARDFQAATAKAAQNVTQQLKGAFDKASKEFSHHQL